jgi:hypothetical protein
VTRPQLNASFAVKPCPFCGLAKIDLMESNEVYVPKENERKPISRGYWFYCRSCKASGPVRETIVEAGLKWDGRANA